MINIVYAEASLELVPLEILRHPSVRRNAKRRGKPPEETLLDKSLHHWAMDKLKNSEKRGRPDILHFLLLEALGSPLNRKGALKVWVHTVGNYSIFINPSTRLPRDFNRFKSLMEQLFVDGRSPPKGEPLLLELRRLNISQLLRHINPDVVYGLSSKGEPGSFDDVARELSKYDNPLVLIGAFPHGSFEKETEKLASKIFSVYYEPLEAWTVNSRLIYELEKKLEAYPSGEIL
jgi:rRNA small subunit pseudouridine methyltransferase Nep1